MLLAGKFKTLAEMATSNLEFYQDYAKDMGPGDIPMPTWLIATASDLIAIATPFIGPDDQIPKIKDAVAAAIRAKLQESGALAYVYISEAWALEAHPDDYAGGQLPEPRKSEGRKEIIVIIGETKDGESLSWHVPIDRDAQGLRVYGQVTKLNGTSTTGRFTHMFEEPLP